MKILLLIYRGCGGSLQSLLIEAQKSPKDQPEPSPSRYSITGGLGVYLSEEHFNLLCKLVGAQAMASIRSGQDMVNPNVPLLSSDSFWPSQGLDFPTSVFGKGSTGAGQKANLGASFGRSGP